MAEVKWIKLHTAMFDNSKIKYIRTLPEGNNMVLIWVMLLSKAGKCNANGFIFLTENIPYTPQMLAAEFGYDSYLIELALGTFAKLNMIQLEDHIIKIAGWEEHQNIDGLDRIREQTRKRVEKYRTKQKALMESMSCQYCGKPATGYDHIIAISKGGKDIDENKVPCCIDCNRIKNDKPLVDFLNKNRERIIDDLVLNNLKLSKFATLSNVTGRYEVTQCNAIEEEREEEEEIDINIYSSIINYLNKQANTRYRVNNKKTKALIKARLNEGFTEDDFYKVIDNKVNEWANTDMNKYLRPETLFSPKFEGYLNQKELKNGQYSNGKCGNRWSTGKDKKSFNVNTESQYGELSDEDRRRAEELI